MRIVDKELIFTDLNLTSKVELLEFIANKFFDYKKVNDKKKYVEDVLEREKEFSTNLGNGFCIPHAKSMSVDESSIAIVKNNVEIKWDDDEPAKIFFVLAICESDKGTLHLRILSQIAQKLMEDEFVQSIENAKSSEEIFELMKNMNEVK